MNEKIDPKAAAKAFSMLGASKGGNARAAKLSPEERSEIAKRAVEARWAKSKSVDSRVEPPKATHAGVVKIGDIELPCAVLEGGVRVFTQEGFLQAIGRSKKAPGVTRPVLSGEETEVEQLPAFLDASNLKQFISQELIRSSKPILFKPLSSGTVAKGFRVELLPLVCRVYLEARDAGVLTKGERFGQMRIAAQCDILVRGLATVGIVALVDEATGYQSVRPQDALAEILEKFISKELAKWAKMFPDEFYEQMFRLRGWQYSPDTSQRPILAAKLTNDLVYSRLAPGVLDELQSITPKDTKGRRKHKYHQRLTEDVGNPRLREHLASVITLMRATDRWSTFYALINRALPRFNVTKDLPFPIDDE